MRRSVDQFSRFAAVLALALLCVSAVHAISSYQDLQNELRDPVSLDKQIPDSLRGTLGTNNWIIIVGGAGTDYYWLDTLNGHVIRTGRGRRYSPPASAIILTTRQTIDGILSSKNRFSATTQAIRDGRIQISFVNGGGTQLRLTVGAARLGLLGSSAPQGIKTVGDVCQHGGECVTGNCVGAGYGPPWTYLCSCDPFRYATSGPQCAAPAVVPSAGYPAGQVCKHGGECSSGNCVGDGMGPPWTYRCSCNPTRYTQAGC